MSLFEKILRIIKLLGKVFIILGILLLVVVLAFSFSNEGKPIDELTFYSGFYFFSLPSLFIGIALILPDYLFRIRKTEKMKLVKRLIVPGVFLLLSTILTFYSVIELRRTPAMGIGLAIGGALFYLFLFLMIVALVAVLSVLVRAKKAVLVLLLIFIYLWGTSQIFWYRPWKSFYKDLARMTNGSACGLMPLVAPVMFLSSDYPEVNCYIGIAVEKKISIFAIKSVVILAMEV